jgi:plastocyanin
MLQTHTRKSPRRAVVRFLLAAAAGAGFAGGAARADVLLDQTSIVGAASVAPPAEYSFTATTAQALTLTLNDIQIPAAFQSLQVAVTLGDSLVGSVAVDATTHKGTLNIPAAAGNYTLHVIGLPDATQNIGSFGVCVAPATSVTSCVALYSFSGNIQTPATAKPGTSTLNTNFTATSAGSYTVTITDDAFPVALQSVNGASVAGGIAQGSVPIVGLTSGTTQVTLAAGVSYQLILAALADATVQAGLYGVRITDPSGNAVYDRTLPVGTMAASTIVQNPATQALSLTLTDFAYPAPLSSAGIEVTQGSSVLASLTAPGSLPNFTGSAGSIEIWQYVVAGSQPGVYSATLSTYQPSGSAVTNLYSNTQVVNPGAASAATSYAFVAPLTSGGTYNLVTNDFQFPAAFASLAATVAQNGAVLTQTSTGNFTAVAGPIVVVVNAAPPSGGIGIFGVTVQTSGTSPQIILDQTQAVGGVLGTRAITVSTTGSYDVTLADLGFPANFQNLAVVVSQGSQVQGKIFGGGTFSFSGTPGQYVLSTLATPTTTATIASANDYGLYSVRVAASAPSLTFTASATSVAAGSAVTLTWAGTDVTSCVAGGATGWTGTEQLSGTSSVTITATSALTLTCTGPGGSVSQSVNVTATAATPAASSSSGGGGALGYGALLALGALVLARSRRGRSLVTQL